MNPSTISSHSSLVVTTKARLQPSRAEKRAHLPHCIITHYHSRSIIGRSRSAMNFEDRGSHDFHISVPIAHEDSTKRERTSCVENCMLEFQGNNEQQLNSRSAQSEVEHETCVICRAAHFFVENVFLCKARKGRRLEKPLHSIVSMPSQLATQ